MNPEIISIHLCVYPHAVFDVTLIGKYHYVSKVTMRCVQQVVDHLRLYIPGVNRLHLTPMCAEIPEPLVSLLTECKEIRLSCLPGTSMLDFRTLIETTLANCNVVSLSLKSECLTPYTLPVLTNRLARHLRELMIEETYETSESDEHAQALLALVDQLPRMVVLESFTLHLGRDTGRISRATMYPRLFRTIPRCARLYEVLHVHVRDRPSLRTWAMICQSHEVRVLVMLLLPISYPKQRGIGAYLLREHVMMLDLFLNTNRIEWLLKSDY